MSIFRKITFVILSVVFLLSSTGLFLIHHECRISEISGIFLNTDYKNDDHKHVCDQLSQISCCSGSACEKAAKENFDCCEDNTYYLIISEPYTFSFNKIKFQEISFRISSFIDHIIIDKNNSINTSTKIIKPPDLFGTDLLFNICILRL